MAKRQSVRPTVVVDVAKLRAHPRNYRKHVPAQIEHIRQSLRDHGVYKNVVVAKDWTLLAGHGVAEACVLEGVSQLPVVRLDLDPDDPRALRILAGDNEVARLAEDDDAQLVDLLKQIAEDDDGLLGTGFDEAELDELIQLEERRDGVSVDDPAGEWGGMPEFDQQDKTAHRSIKVHFADEAAVKKFEALIGKGLPENARYLWYPEMIIERFADKRYAADEEEPDGDA